jgi:hypothetical protein
VPHGPLECVRGPPHRPLPLVPGDRPAASPSDHGLTFGTTTTGGVCLQLRDPVPGIDPLGLIRHPSLTLTVADPQRFAAAMRRYAGTGPGHTALAQDGE